MKGKVMPVQVQLDEQTLQQLVTEVKETVAVEPVKGIRKFAAVDMWNNQRKAKQASGFLNKWQLY